MWAKCYTQNFIGVLFYWETTISFVFWVLSPNLLVFVLVGIDVNPLFYGGSFLLEPGSMENLVFYL